MRFRTISTIAASVLLLVALAGCEVTADPAPAQPQASGRGDNDDGPIHTSGRGANSALGAAKQSAENTVSNLEQRNQDLLKEMDGEGDDR